MKEQNIYQERLKINNKKKELEKQLKETENELSNLQNKCPHSIVLAFDDYRPHKIGRIYQFLCPACGKRENIYPTHELEKSTFKDSRIMDFTMFPITFFNDHFSSIMEYIFNNFDYCYDKNNSEKEITKSILINAIQLEEDKNKEYKVLKKE